MNVGGIGREKIRPDLETFQGNDDSNQMTAAFDNSVNINRTPTTVADPNNNNNNSANLGDSLLNTSQDLSNQATQSVSEWRRQAFASRERKGASYSPPNSPTLEKDSRKHASYSSIEKSPMLTRAEYEVAITTEDEFLLKEIKCEGSQFTSLLLQINESIISSKDLFLLIQRDLSRSMKSQNELTLLLRFCIEWVENNRGTSQLEQCIEIFSSIFKQMQFHPDKKIRHLNGELNKVVINRKKGEDDSEITHILVSTPSGAKVKQDKDELEITSILKSIRAGAVVKQDKLYKQSIQKLVSDFFKVHVDFYKDVKPGHLINGETETSLVLLSYNEKCNKTTKSIVQEILQEPEPEKIRRLLIFFLKIAHNCWKKNHDLASVAFIMAAVSHSAIVRLKEEVINKLPTKYQTRSQFLDSLVSPNNQFQLLIKQINDYQSAKFGYIPYLVPHLQELTNIQATMQNKSLIEGAMTYNFLKLKSIKESVDRLLWPQSQIQLVNSSYCSDFYTNYLQRKTFLSDNDIFNLSYKIRSMPGTT